MKVHTKRTKACYIFFTGGGPRKGNERAMKIEKVGVHLQDKKRNKRKNVVFTE